jgi:hypothetical protein
VEADFVATPIEIMARFAGKAGEPLPSAGRQLDIDLWRAFMRKEAAVQFSRALPRNRDATHGETAAYVARLRPTPRIESDGVKWHLSYWLPFFYRTTPKIRARRVGEIPLDPHWTPSKLLVLRFDDVQPLRV